MEIVTVVEVYLLLQGEFRASERAVPGASTTQKIELPIVHGYHSHCLTNLLVREVSNLLIRAQYVAPVQAVAFQGFLGLLPNQEDDVQPYGCFYNGDGSSCVQPRCLVQGFGGSGFMCGGTRIVERW